MRLNYSIDADLLFAGPNKSEFDAKIVALNDEVQDFNERLWVLPRTFLSQRPLAGANAHLGP